MYNKKTQSSSFLLSCLDDPSIQSEGFHAGLYNNLGNLQYDNNNLLQATTYYRKSLALNPFSFDARHSLSQCLRKLKLPNLSYKILLEGYEFSTSLQDRLGYMQPIANILIELKDNFGEDDSPCCILPNLLRNNCLCCVKNNHRTFFL